MVGHLRFRDDNIRICRHPNDNNTYLGTTKRRQLSTSPISHTFVCFLIIYIKSFTVYGEHIYIYRKYFYIYIYIESPLRFMVNIYIYIYVYIESPLRFMVYGMKSFHRSKMT